MLASASGRRIVSALPPERVLTETDGPFVIVRGRPARPANIADVLAGLAQLWQLEPTTTARHIHDNFRLALTRDPAG